MREMIKNVGGSDADRCHAGVLDSGVGVEEGGSYGTGPRFSSMAEETLYPVGGDHLGIVIEEEEVIAPGQ